jgi:hypothetical protein
MDSNDVRILFPSLLPCFSLLLSCVYFVVGLAVPQRILALISVGEYIFSSTVAL